MKKLFLTLSLATAVAFVNAQDMTSKKGTPILPEKGDWSIGFQANTLIQYFGNMFSQNGNPNSSLSSQQNWTLVGLCVDKNDESKAMRAKVRIGFGSKTTEPNPGSIGQDSLDNPSKTEHSDGFNVTLGAGLQKSRGKGRLHGIYGAEAQIMFGTGTDDKNTFAKPITATDLPTNNSRTLETKGGSSFSIGVDGFIGAEYFFAPKMSISAEYGWGISFGSTGDAETTTEKWDAAANNGNGAVASKTAKGGKTSTLTVDVMNAGSIIFHLYF